MMKKVSELKVKSVVKASKKGSFVFYQTLGAMTK